MSVGLNWRLSGAAVGAVATAGAGVVAGLEPKDLISAAQWLDERLLAIALIGLVVTVCVGDLSFSIVRSGGKNTSFVLGFGGRWRPASPPGDAQPDPTDGDSDKADSTNPATTHLIAVPDPKPKAPTNVRRFPALQQTLREDDQYAIRLLESGQPLPPYWSGYVMGRFVVDQIPQDRDSDHEQLTLPI